MNSLWHLIISLIKSAIRIISGILSVKLQSLEILAIGLILAEILGIIEELKDER